MASKAQKSKYGKVLAMAKGKKSKGKSSAKGGKMPMGMKGKGC